MLKFRLLLFLAIFMNIVIIGSQWGDEGKGKIVDYLSEKAEITVRFQGGNNAGHTVIIGSDIFKLHHIPSGICQNKICVLGNGVVINLPFLITEIKQLQEKGLSVKDKLFISEKAHIITQKHQDIDKKQEENRSNKVGTTGKGIGPCYTDKVSRFGVRMIDFINNKDLIPEYSQYYDLIKSFIIDTTYFLNKAIREGKNIIFEGAQGTFLDIDHGTYPYVTSSNTISSAACTGSGIAPKHINKVIGILKAYTTRVGNGPFPCELNNDIGEFLVNEGKEFGTTTGRKRRCGWLDLFMANYAVDINGIDYWVITKLDVLNKLEEINVCIGYEYENKKLISYPSLANILENVKPIYKKFNGWKTSLENCKTFKDLPIEAKEYLNFIQEFTNIPIAIVSIGPERNQNIVLKDIWS
ncbi:MAG: adenylosuccinate synthetase [Candidatus Sericytochromatia bacterium]|nr:MAG: adenylosuccinate synthetase [Candidatus Sericytochromatia bacterium]